MTSPELEAIEAQAAATRKRKAEQHAAIRKAARDSGLVPSTDEPADPALLEADRVEEVSAIADALGVSKHNAATAEAAADRAEAAAMDALASADRMERTAERMADLLSDTIAAQEKLDTATAEAEKNAAAEPVPVTDAADPAPDLATPPKL